MCGIVGFVGEADPRLLDEMTDALVHRGPDGRGVWVGPRGEAHLGHRRLAIVDLHSGAQPMWTADGALGITFNGEIYNHLELRKELGGLGHRFVSDHADTEVLLHGYRQWGEGLQRRLNGMWAFVIYDRPRRMLFGSRDRFGKKPLYYALPRGGFAFASELAALRLHPGIDATMSRRALQKYFGYGYIPAPLTVIEGARKLPAGHCFRYGVADGSFEIRKYWDFVPEPDDGLARSSDEELGATLRSLLDAAVGRRLMSDVPLGFFLSGGIDSSAVAMLAARRLGGEQTRTFSIAFAARDFDESAHAALVARTAGTTHAAQTLDLDRGRALLPQIVGRLDEPLGDASILPTYQLCAYTRRHVTVALGGDGADELFAGYDPFRAIGLARLYERVMPRRLHAAIRHLGARLPVSHGYMSSDFRLKRMLRGLSYRPALWGPMWMSSLDEGELSRLFGEPVDLEDVFSEAIAHWDACPSKSDVDRLLVYYTKLYLQDDILTKVDRASMAVSLEVRSPFLDIDLVDFVRRLPTSRKYRRGTTKYLLRRALASLLPSETVRRPKQGFGVPIGKWFRDGALVVNGETTEALGLSRDFVMEKRREHERNQVDQRAFLWNQWLLEQWLSVPTRGPQRAAVA
jgi:asparagine synthase (glutamine-hydrolysing)